MYGSLSFWKLQFKAVNRTLCSTNSQVIFFSHTVKLKSQRSSLELYLTYQSFVLQYFNFIWAAQRHS